MSGRTVILYAAAAVQAYLLGAIPFGYLLAKYVKGIDVRTVGSGNIGATNVGRAAGVKLGIVAFALDVGKGMTAATLIPFCFWVLAGGEARADGAGEVLRLIIAGRGFVALRILCGLAAIAGHVWTIFLRLKGGKGVATSLGVMLGLAPWPTLAAFFIWAVVARISGYVSLASITAAAALPVAFVVMRWGELREEWLLTAFVTLVAVIVILRHRGNIKRLLAGSESRFNLRGGGGHGTGA